MKKRAIQIIPSSGETLPPSLGVTPNELEIKRSPGRKRLP